MTTEKEGEKRGKEKRFTAAECFRAMLRKLLEEEGYGAQVRLAEAVGRGTKHVNDVVRGRRDASLDFQERAAAYYGRVPEEMVASGRRLLMEGGDVFPYAEETRQIPDREERGKFIFNKVIEDAGLKNNRFFSDRELQHVMPDEWGQYVGEAMHDGELYNLTKKEIQLIVDTVAKHFPKKGRKQRTKKT
jgi:hypothetical protein